MCSLWYAVYGLCHSCHFVVDGDSRFDPALLVFIGDCVYRASWDCLY